MRRGLVAAIVAIAAIGLAACADSLAPVAPRVASSPSFDLSIDVGGVEICTPCPPGLICAAVCETSDPVPVPEVAGDTTTKEGTSVSVGFGPAATTRTQSSPSGVAQR